MPTLSSYRHHEGTAQPLLGAGPGGQQAGRLGRGGLRGCSRGGSALAPPSHLWSTAPACCDLPQSCYCAFAGWRNDRLKEKHCGLPGRGRSILQLAETSSWRPSIPLSEGTPACAAGVSDGLTSPRVGHGASIKHSVSHAEGADGQRQA